MKGATQTTLNRVFTCVSFSAMLCCSVASIADALPDLELTVEELLVNSAPLALQQLKQDNALTTLDKSLLHQANISNTSELVKLAPSLTALQSFNNRQSAFLIRGLGTLIFSSGIEPSVVTMVDGVSQGSAAQGMLPLLDLNRVDIWRGPQISRFGRNSAAGAINLVSERAGNEWQGRLQLGASSVGALDSETTEASAFFGGPLHAKLGARIGVFTSHSEGFIDNVFDGQRLNDGRQQAALAKFDWAASESLSAALDISYGEAHADCCAPTATVASPQISNILLPVQVGSANRQSNTNAPFIANSRTSSVRFDIDKLLGPEFLSGAVAGFRLKFVSAYSLYSERESQDFDFLPIDIIPISAGYDKHEQFSQHVRLMSPAGSPWEYSLGAYFERQTRNREYARSFLTLPEAELQATVRKRSTAIFGKLAIDMMERVTFNAGLRYSKDQIEFVASREAFALQDLTAIVDVNDDTSSKTVDAEASLLYMASDTSSLYLRWSRGHKAPAYNIVFDLDANALEPVGRERGSSLELAYKRYFPEQQWMLGTTLFHTNFDNYQAQVQEPGSAKLMLVNSGGIGSYGLEFETSWQYRRFKLHSSLDWMAARIGNVEGVLCGSGELARGECPEGFRNLKGEQLPFAPDLKLKVLLHYTLAAKPLGMTLAVDSLYRWQSAMQTAFNNDPLREEAAFGLWAIGASLSNEALWARVYVNNVFNKNFALAHFDNPVDAGGYVSFFAREAHRSLGLSIRYSF